MTLGPRLISLVALFTITSCYPQQPRFAPDDFTRTHNIVDTAILPLMEKWDLPGIAVAITIDGQALFFNYGVASRESGAPVSEETLFEIGSVSKTFTGTLAAYAEVLEKLSADDRPGQYLSELRGSPIDQVSLLHLGTYTAGGLPLQFPEDVSDEERMLRFFQQWEPDAAPGAQRRYSNPSIGLLGRITALALESDFVDAVEGQLLPELGLNQSFVRVPEHVMARYAWGYSAENEPIRVNPGMFDAEAYGIKSTAADMIRFVQVNIDPSQVAWPVQSAIEETHVGYFRIGEMVQGLGWEQYPYPLTLERLLAGNSRTMILEPNAATQLTPAQTPSGPTLFNKTGSTNGFGAYVAFVPEEKIGIVMLANRNFPNAERIRVAHEILEQLAPVGTSASLEGQADGESGGTHNRDEGGRWDPEDPQDRDDHEGRQAPDQAPVN